jgi:putative metalloprotease
MHKFIFLILFLLIICLAGCEGSNVLLVKEAGVDAVKAITLSDEAVQNMAKKSSAYADSQHRVAPPENEYAKRLKRLVGDHHQESGIDFNYKIYLAKEVNAFAMADGTIRIYSGLMDMLNDDELRFVIGHEMGHIAMKHIHKKLQLAYGSSAVRKAIATIDGPAGDIARSQLGGFVQGLMGAQFSQFEEKEADDYGLTFMRKQGYDTKAAVSALNKIAKLGNDHSFLSSHPAPGKRAERLKLQIEGKTSSIEEGKQSLSYKFKELLNVAYEKLMAIVQWVASFF